MDWYPGESQYGANERFLGLLALSVIFGASALVIGVFGYLAYQTTVVGSASCPVEVRDNMPGVNCNGTWSSLDKHALRAHVVDFVRTGERRPLVCMLQRNGSAKNCMPPA